MCLYLSTMQGLFFSSPQSPFEVGWLLNCAWAKVPQGTAMVDGKQEPASLNSWSSALKTDSFIQLCALVPLHWNSPASSWISTFKWSLGAVNHLPCFFSLSQSCTSSSTKLFIAILIDDLAAFLCMCLLQSLTADIFPSSHECLDVYHCYIWFHHPSGKIFPPSGPHK